MVVGAPEIGVRHAPGGLVGFTPLHDQVVFPQLPYVVAQRQGVEVLDQAVAHAVVAEIVTGVLGHLFAQVARKAAHLEDDEHLLQQVKIALDGLAVHCQAGSQLCHGDFLADLEGQQAQQIDDFIRLADTLQIQQVAVEVGADQLAQQALAQPRVIRGGNGRVAAPDQPALKLAAGFQRAQGMPQFAVAHWVQVEGQLPPGKRLADLVGQLKRGRAGCQDHGLGIAVYQDLQVQPDIRHALRFVDHQQLGVA